MGQQYHLRVPGAVCAACMVTLVAESASALKQDFGAVEFETLAACPSDALANLFVDEFLLAAAAGSRRPPQHDGGARIGGSPVRHDDGVGGALLEHLGPVVPAGGQLGVGPFRRVSRTLAAQLVAAVLAQAALVAVVAALVACAMDADVG